MQADLPASAASSSSSAMSYQTGLSNDFWDQADLVLVVEGQPLPVHTTVMGLYSRVLWYSISAGCSGSSSGPGTGTLPSWMRDRVTVQLPNGSAKELPCLQESLQSVKLAPMVQVLRFMYQSANSLSYDLREVTNVQDVEDILMLADFLQVLPLLAVCDKQLAQLAAAGTLFSPEAPVTKPGFGTIGRASEATLAKWTPLACKLNLRLLLAECERAITKEVVAAVESRNNSIMTTLLPQLDSHSLARIMWGVTRTTAAGLAAEGRSRSDARNWLHHAPAARDFQNRMHSSSQSTHTR